MPWLAVPWQQAGVRAELAQLYGVRGIPTLLLVDGNGHVITHDARTELIEDPLAQVRLMFCIICQTEISIKIHSNLI